MDELQTIMAKYDGTYVNEQLVTAEDVTAFAGIFYRDVAEIFDVITRVRNRERNPSWFSIGDAPVLGLLVRMWKLLKEIVGYYEANNAEMVGILDRPFLEAATMASYLLASDGAVMEDYRKCSYRHRLRMLRDAEAGHAFYNTKAGRRLLVSIRRKLAFERFTKDDFATQQRHGWRVQGKSFFDVFRITFDEGLYASSYGIMSESIHGSWNDSMDFCLTQHEDGTFSPFPGFQPADIRFVSPLLLFAVPAYTKWLQRIDAYDENLKNTLEWVGRVNRAIFAKFDASFDGP